MRIKPLRQILKTYFRKPIPPMAWLPALIALFQYIKVCITSSPVLAWYELNKPIFLKTDWSDEGMGYILIQSSSDPKSIATTKLLRKTEECVFDTTKSGARLQPILFSSRYYTGLEQQ